MISAQGLARAGLPALLLCLPLLAQADFEVRDPSGRRILVEDQGTWRYLDAAGAPAAPAAAASAAEAPKPPPPQAKMQLLRRSEVPGGCGFEVQLDNLLPYEVRSLVPFFAVYRSSGALYVEQSLHFGVVRPGDSQRRELRVAGLACADIARLQVQGGDRCDMGELNKFSDAKGECLARVQVLPSALLKFEK